MASPVVCRRSGPQREAEAHQPDPEHDRDEAAQPEVDDRLVDRQVERPDVDRDPLLEDELVLRVEVSFGGRAEGSSSLRAPREVEARLVSSSAL